MFCSKCGAPMSETDTFCRACGQQVDQTAPAATSAPGGPAPYSNLPPAAPYVASPSAAGGYYQGLYLDPVTRRPLASYGRRVLAYLLDGVILWIASFVVNALFGPAFTTETVACTSSVTGCPQLHFNGGHTALVIILGFAISACYWILLVGGRRGQTVGMMALSIGVRSATHDERITYGAAFVRWLVLTVLFCAFILPGVINLLSPLWDRRRQAWHDHAAGSVVVDLRWPAPTT